MMKRLLDLEAGSYERSLRMNDYVSGILQMQKVRFQGIKNSRMSQEMQS